MGRMPIDASPAAPRVRVSPFIRDIGSAALASLATMAALVLVTRWLAEGLGPDSFGAWGLSRRLFSSITVFSTMPFGIAIARDLAREPSPSGRAAIRAAATGLVVIPNVALLLIGFSARGPLAAVLFNDAARVPLLMASLVSVVGLSCYTVVFAWYRGTEQIRRGNLWQVVVLGAGPALIAYLLRHSGDPASIVLWTGAVTFLAGVPLAYWLVQALRAPVLSADVLDRARLLARYALPRIPGGLAFGGLMALGPFLAPYLGSLREAGYLIAGQSAMRVVEGGTAAFGLVVLPRLSSLQATSSAAYLRERVTDVVSVALHLGLFASGALLVWSREVVLVWLGPAYLPAVASIRLLLLAVSPYLVYSLLRSVIDALEERAINMRNLFLALGIGLLASGGAALLGLGVEGLAGATTLAFFGLGIATWRFLHSSLSLAGHDLDLARAGALTAIILLVIAIIRALLVPHLSPTALLGVGVLLEGAGLAAYLWLLRRAGTRWLIHLERRIAWRRG
ncbi:MAG: lipopolysaccharide biosynthesis protein [Gemmatimonadetes bacterium]|nr:lipopolysaccharide biosynthesis protein [Gemmatimonadota bacterium]